MAEARFEMRVAHIQAETDDIRRFVLVPVGGAPLPAWTPGAHIDLHLGPQLVRQYSLCNGPDERGSFTLAVKREAASRGGSQHLHDSVQVGDVLTVSGPRNHFPLADDASEHLLLGGGIGVTPLLAMARQLQAQGKPFQLKYFTRSPGHTAFHAELSGPAWARQVDFHYAVKPERLGAYLRTVLGARPAGRHVYVCGPRPFMDLVHEIAAHAYPAGTVHSEYFSADPAAQAGPQDGFRVRCARLQRDFDIPEGRSIVHVLADHGINIDVLCEQGVCGTCLTGVLDGTPDHRDAYLSDDERAANDKMLICCSRALSPMLVLDL